jgi:glutathione S-transferase
MSQLTLIIGNKNYSSWSLRPWVFLRQNQIEFKEKRVALFTATSDNELAPYGSDYKVPILLDGSLTIWDSLAILEYLSEKYLSSQGWPAAERARAVARAVSAEMHSSFTNIRNELPMNCRKKFAHVNVSAAAEREIDRIKSLWRMCRNEFGVEGEWLFGQYSIADAMFAPIALRFEGYSIPLEGVEKAYVHRVLQQPCIVEWIEAGKAEKEIIAADEIEA